MHIYCRESVNNLCLIGFCISVEITNVALGTTEWVGWIFSYLEKKGHVSFFKLHFLLSSSVLASFPCGAGEPAAFLAPNEFVFFSPSFTAVLLAHIDASLGLLELLVWLRAQHRLWGVLLCYLEGKTWNRPLIKNKALKDWGMENFSESKGAPGGLRGRRGQSTRRLCGYPECDWSLSVVVTVYLAVYSVRVWALESTCLIPVGFFFFF